MIHVCISGSLGTGVDPGDRAEAEEEEKEEVRSVGVVFLGLGYRGLLCWRLAGWSVEGLLTRAADAHVEICPVQCENTIADA